MRRSSAHSARLRHDRCCCRGNRRLLRGGTAAQMRRSIKSADRRSAAAVSPAAAAERRRCVSQRWHDNIGHRERERTAVHRTRHGAKRSPRTEEGVLNGEPARPTSHRGVHCSRLNEYGTDERIVLFNMQDLTDACGQRLTCPGQTIESLPNLIDGYVDSRIYDNGPSTYGRAKQIDAMEPHQFIYPKSFGRGTKSRHETVLEILFISMLQHGKRYAVHSWNVSHDSSLPQFLIRQYQKFCALSTSDF